MSDSEQGRPVVHEEDDEEGFAELTRQLRRLRTIVAANQITGDAEVEAEAIRRIADDLAERATPSDPAAYDQWGAGEHIMSNPVVGSRSVVAPPLEMVEWPDGHVTAEITLDFDYEGPPGYVHGGIIALLFDELLGTANGKAGFVAMTVDLRTTYVSPTPLREPLHFDARVENRDGRKIWTVGELHAGDRLCAKAEGLFVIPRILADQPVEDTRGTMPGAGGTG